MKIENAKYMTDVDGKNNLIKATIDNQVLYIPLYENNRHYAEFKRQVDDGELTIEDAD